MRTLRRPGERNRGVQRGGMAGGGHVTGLLVARAAVTAATLLARHRVAAVPVEGGDG